MKLEIRAVLGSGDGELRHTPQGESPSNSDLSMRMGSIGLRRSLAPREQTDLAFRMDASHSRIKTREGTALIDGLTADSWRIRAGIEATRSLALRNNRELSPFMEVSMRKGRRETDCAEKGLNWPVGCVMRRPRLSVEMRGRGSGGAQ